MAVCPCFMLAHPALRLRFRQPPRFDRHRAEMTDAVIARSSDAARRRFPHGLTSSPGIGPGNNKIDGNGDGDPLVATVIARK